MTRRAYYWPILIIGIILIVVPFAISMPTKAGAGQAMLDNFHPIMQPASVKETVDLYNNTFLPLQSVASGGVAAAGETTQMMSGLAEGLHMTPAQMEQFMATNYPAMAKLLGSFPQLVPIFSNVAPGINHFKPLVATMQGNVTNYAKVDSLPNFRLFTWFFVIPGVLIVLLALLGLGVFQRGHRGKSTTQPQTVGGHKW